MALYRWQDDRLTVVKKSKFEDKNVPERKLQQLLGRHPDALEEGLFTIATEYSLARLGKTQRAVDLLALDQKNGLVVVELKRDQKGAHAELQAIRYAALVSNMTHDEVIEAHADYLEKKSNHEPGDEKKGEGAHYNEEAKKAIHEHLDGREINTVRPRIILASADFSKELTASVLWLCDNFKVDITCVKVTLYETGKEKLLDTDTIIPLPEAKDYLLKRQEQRVQELDQQEKERKDNFTFSMVGIEDGDTLVYKKDPTKKCTAIGKRELVFEGTRYSLTGLAKKFGGTQGTRSWVYKDEALQKEETLQERRERLEGESPTSVEY